MLLDLFFLVAAGTSPTVRLGCFCMRHACSLASLVASRPHSSAIRGNLASLLRVLRDRPTPPNRAHSVGSARSAINTLVSTGTDFATARRRCLSTATAAASLLNEANWLPNNVMLLRSASGSCWCGRVQFEVALPFRRIVECSRSRCGTRKGKRHIAHTVAGTSAFRWFTGMDAVYRYDPGILYSSANSHCLVCYSPVPHLTRNKSEVIIPIGALD